jgi:hypothetical protein
MAPFRHLHDRSERPIADIAISVAKAGRPYLSKRFWVSGVRLEQEGGAMGGLTLQIAFAPLSSAFLFAIVPVFSAGALAQSTQPAVESAIKVGEALQCSVWPRRNERGPRSADDLERVRKYADAGNDACTFILAGWNERGEGMPVNHKEAMRLYTAASQKRPAALVGIGRLYESGHGVAQSYGTAIDYYMKAVNQGSAEGEVALGSMYEQGRGVDISLRRAATLYRSAIAKNNADACFALDRLHAEHGVLTREEVDEDVVRWKENVRQQTTRLAETAHRHVEIKQPAQLELDLVFRRGLQTVQVRIARSSGDEKLDLELARLYSGVSACLPAGFEPQRQLISARLPLNISP